MSAEENLGMPEENQGFVVCSLGHTNPGGSRFCGDCGRKLGLDAQSAPVRTCARGHEIVEGTRQCGQCAALEKGTPSITEPGIPPRVPRPPPQPTTSAALGSREVENGPPEVTRRASRRLVLWLVGGLGLILVLAGIGAALSPDGTETVRSDASASPAPPSLSASPSPSPSPEPIPPPDVRMPDIVGMTTAKARAAIQTAVNRAGGEAELELNLKSKYSKREGGTILAATTLVNGESRKIRGMQVPSGNTIFLVVAKPIPRVPSVVGLQEDRAKRELEARGFDVRIRRVTSTLAEGIVLSQSVPAGAQRLPGGDPIGLSIAKPQPGVFISVMGTGSALVTWIDGNFSTHQLTVPLPFTRKVVEGDSFSSISMSAQRQLGDSGSITCSIIDFGDVVKKSTSRGAYSICSVTY